MTAPIGEVDVAPVEVVIIDDHPLFIRGIELVLPRASEGRLAVTGITDDAAQAAGLVRRCRPDIAMVDLSMPAELVGPLLAVMDGWAVLPPVVLAQIAGRPAPAASVTVTADQRRLWRWVAARATTVETTVACASPSPRAGALTHCSTGENQGPDEEPVERDDERGGDGRQHRGD